MKIFYGVQGTGNGHITRARIMAKELYAAGIDVTFLFTGRPAGEYFEMDIFKDYQTLSGLTFIFHKGQVQYIETALKSKPITFFKEINDLNLNGYDLVISDFEPVTAWAAIKQRKKVLGIGHQYAFNHKIPKSGADPIAATIMKYFAPVDLGVGLHWHHFGQPILPPLIDIPELPDTLNKNKILVYLPFETLNDINQLLEPFTDFEFHVYTTDQPDVELAHLRYKPVARENFKQDFADSVGIISNAGFELASESLRAGKKILAKPLHAQMEQISNALALKQLGFGQTMFELDRQVVKDWLATHHAVRVTYPNVAQKIVEWLKNGMPEMDHHFISSVWNEVDILQINH